MTQPLGHDPERKPGTASAERGEVLLDGPDGVAVSMDPDAAEETGKSLITAAEEAREQAGEETTD